MGHISSARQLSLSTVAEYFRWQLVVDVKILGGAASNSLISFQSNKADGAFTSSMS